MPSRARPPGLVRIHFQLFGLEISASLRSGLEPDVAPVRQASQAPTTHQESNLSMPPGVAGQSDFLKTTEERASGDPKLFHCFSSIPAMPVDGTANGLVFQLNEGPPLEWVGGRGG